jgi:putative salt-induced outer membrane protein
MFAELDYVNDRFDGFDSRISELLGYGHRFYDNKAFKLIGEGSIGARQTELTNGENENEIIGKLAAKSEWALTDNISWNNSASSALGSDLVTTDADSNLRIQLQHSLYLKAGVNVEHVSETDAGKEKVDTTTRLNIGYEF